MLIAPAAHTLAVQRVAPSAHQATDPAPVDPAPATFKLYSRDLMSLPGAQRAGWSKAEPGVIRVVFATDAFRRLADNVLRDAVEGVQLLLTVDPAAPAPVPGGDAWADNPTEMARAIRAMPGVIDGSFDSEHGVHTMTFQVTNAAVSARLRPLLSDHLGRYSTHFWAPARPPA